MKINIDKLNKAADDYAFQVPYDGSNEFYDLPKLKAFKDGIKWAEEYFNKYLEKFTYTKENKQPLSEWLMLSRPIMSAEEIEMLISKIDEQMEDSFPPKKVAYISLIEESKFKIEMS